MQVQDKVVVVTGGGGGIGQAMCRRFHREGARAIVVADIELQNAQRVAKELGGVAIETNVAIESDMQRLVDQTLDRYQQIDLFCSNAGQLIMGGVTTDLRDWQKMWEINVMSHVFAARAVLPGMVSRSCGYLLLTVSAAGLLSQIGSAPYSVTKHAAVGLAEWLAFTYACHGIKVSCLCPQGVKTNMMRDTSQGVRDYLGPSAIEPELVAESVMEGLQSEQFMILPHPEVAGYFLNKATDYQRWIQGMTKLQAKFG